jgi:hypothetical protein
MTARYSIMVREHGSDHDVELLQVNSNPDAIVAGLRAKTLKLHTSIFQPGKRVLKVPKYTYVRVVDHEAM